MTFKLWADENMTQEIGVLHGDGRMQHVRLNQNMPYLDFLFYFGSPDANIMLQTTQNGGVDLITIAPRPMLSPRQESHVYQAHDVVVVGGFLYRAQNGGSTKYGEAVFPTQQGAVVQDGFVNWVCLGRPHDVSAVQLSLSRDELDMAESGGALVLGTQIRGGAAVPIHLRISNLVGDIYNLPFVPQMALFLNDCEIIQAA